MRAFELARELGIKSKELVEYLGLGSHMEEVDAEGEIRARDGFRFGELEDEDDRGYAVFDYGLPTAYGGGLDEHGQVIRYIVQLTDKGRAKFSYGEWDHGKIVPEPRFLGWLD